MYHNLSYPTPITEGNETVILSDFPGQVVTKACLHQTHTTIPFPSSHTATHQHTYVLADWWQFPPWWWWDMTYLIAEGCNKSWG